LPYGYCLDAPLFFDLHRVKKQPELQSKPEVDASNAIDKLLRTDENKLSVGPALDSKSAANHDARLISAGVLSVLIEKTER
jgi:hypothetical protein